MKHFGLIGYPISHSLSPALFNAGYGGRFSYDLIEGDDFGASYAKFIKDYDGINVTAPFKEKAAEKADILSKECLAIGAANILIKTSEGVKAHNSDYLGVRMWLQQAASEIAGSKDFHSIRVLIAGCGGAGKAAALASSDLGMTTILMNRSRQKAEDIAARNSQGHFEVEDTDNFRDILRMSDILIYNIPMPIPALSALEADDFRRNGTKLRILEANYRNPSFSGKILDMVTQGGSKYTGGRTWLLYQAVTGYEIFTGEKPDLTAMSSILTK